MVLNNSQANIKQVNGAIADTLANRPAAQSTFYLFFSTDTQEIYYDNGSWILLAAVGSGGSVNIYNTNGTLTGDRILDANSNDLTFTNLDLFKTESAGSLINGLFFDFVNTIFKIGQIVSGNGTHLLISDVAGQEIIQARYNGNEQGLELQFNAQVYRLGQLFGSRSPQIIVGTGSNSVRLSTYDNNPNTALDLFIGGLSGQGQFKLMYSGAADGININYPASNYIFGRKDAINFTYLEIDDPSDTLKFVALNASGQYTNFILKGGNTTPYIKAQYLNVDQGLDLDFITRIYRFGQLTGNNNTHIRINDNLQHIIFRATNPEIIFDPLIADEGFVIDQGNALPVVTGSGDLGQTLIATGFDANNRTILKRGATLTFPLRFNGIPDFIIVGGSGIQNLGTGTTGLYVTCSFDPAYLFKRIPVRETATTFEFKTRLELHCQFGGVLLDLGYRTIFSSNTGTLAAQSVNVADQRFQEFGTNYDTQTKELNISIPKTISGSATNYFKIDVLARRNVAGNTSCIGAFINFSI